MNYIGRVLNQKFSGDFLKEALRKADKKMPFRGPEYYQSGQYTGTKRRISKRGNSALRKTGYEVMKSLKSHPPKTDTRVYDFIIKKENEGKSKKQAKIAGLNKFLQIYYARVMEIYKNIA